MCNISHQWVLGSHYIKSAQVLLQRASKVCHPATDVLTRHWLPSKSCPTCQNAVCPAVENLYIIACKSTSCFASSRSMGSSKYLLIDTSSLMPFLLRVLTINSLARAFVGAGSKGRKMMDLSRGSPGTMFHESNVPQQNACPCV